MRMCKFCDIPLTKTKEGYWECCLCGYTFPNKRQREFIKESVDFLNSNIKK